MTRVPTLERTKEPGIYRRQGTTKTTYVVVTAVGMLPNGNPKQVRRSFTTFDEAKRHKVKTEHERRSGIYVEPSREPLGAYLDRWCDNQRGRIKPASIRTYRDARTRVSAIHNIALCDLTATTIQRLYRAMQDAGLSARTVQQTHWFLKRTLKDAVLFRLLTANPCDAVRPPTPPRSVVVRLDSAELARFRAAIVDNDRRVLWETAIETGCRFGELAALKWRDVDLDGRGLVVRETVTRDEDARRILGTPKSDAGVRRVALSSSLVALLRAHRAEIDAQATEDPYWVDRGLVFPNDSGGHRNNRVENLALARACTAANVRKITFHAFRHTSGTQLAAAKIDPKTIAERLGHSRVTTTFQLYVHPDQAEHVAAAEALAVQLNGRVAAALPRRHTRPRKRPQRREK